MAVGFLGKLLGFLTGRGREKPAAPVEPPPYTPVQTPVPDLTTKQEEELRAAVGLETAPPAPPTDATDKMLMEGQWQHMASSNVEAMRYLWDDQTLEVEFKNGAFYQYFQVPPHVAKGFAQTDSPGRFVWNFLRDVYSYVKLSGPSTERKTDAYPRNATVVRLRWEEWTPGERREAVSQTFKGNPKWVPPRMQHLTSP